MTVLSRDRTEVSCGVGGGGECRKMGRKCLSICLNRETWLVPLPVWDRAMCVWSAIRVALHWKWRYQSGGQTQVKQHLTVTSLSIAFCPSHDSSLWCALCHIILLFFAAAGMLLV